MSPRSFVRMLAAFPALPRVFNPWRDVDADNDIDDRAPAHRRAHLLAYLNERVDHARVLLIAEAAGWQGCHFSGLAMTSERILLGGCRDKGVDPADVIEARHIQRTSRPEERPSGANEPTATIVWQAIKRSGIDPRSVVLWNAFAFHPLKDRMLSNRRPTASECAAVRPVLEAFMQLFPDAQTVAIGQVAKTQLAQMDVAVKVCVRHPSQGGATQFREAIARLFGQTQRAIRSSAR